MVVIKVRFVKWEYLHVLCFFMAHDADIETKISVDNIFHSFFYGVKQKNKAEETKTRIELLPPFFSAQISSVYRCNLLNVSLKSTHY